MSLDYRRDVRTVEQFANDIELRTKKETFLVQLFKKEMEYLGHEITIVDNGVDNGGKLADKVTCAPDYLITIDGKKMLLDIKNSPVTHKCTFKVHNLRQYIKMGAGILLFIGTGQIDKNPESINYENTKWAIITTEAIANIVKFGQVYKEKTFGYKDCIKIKESDYTAYFSCQPLEHIGDITL